MVCVCVYAIYTYAGSNMCATILNVFLNEIKRINERSLALKAQYSVANDGGG